MIFDEHGRLTNPRFGPYQIFRADEMPEMDVIFVETYEPSGPFGAKAVAEIPLDGVGPAVANAVYDAVGVRIPDAPLLPEKVWRALREQTKEATARDERIAAVFEAALTAQRDGRSAAMAIIVQTQGSVPRHAGSKMLVWPDGSIVGRSAAARWNRSSSVRRKTPSQTAI